MQPETMHLIYTNDGAQADLAITNTIGIGEWESSNHEDLILDYLVEELGIGKFDCIVQMEHDFDVSHDENDKEVRSWSGCCTFLVDSRQLT